MFGLNGRQNTAAVSTNTIGGFLSGKDFINKFSQTENAVLIDVRTSSEFNSGHIEKAINIDFNNSDFKSEIGKLDKSLTYFIYCRSGNRSGNALQIMKNMGINSIYDLNGGIVSNSDTITLIN